MLNKIKDLHRNINRRALFLLLVAPLALGATSLFVSKNAYTTKVEAATTCPTTSSTGSSSTNTVNIPLSDTYTIWSRTKVPSTTNSYYLKIDSTCYKIVGSNLSANQYGWTNFENGSTGSIINSNLNAGTHSISFIGNESGVVVDRLLLIRGSCVPTGTGDNCALAIDAPPSVTVTNPTDGSIVSGTVNISANVYDDFNVTNVEFLVDTVTVGNITQSPYSYSWNSTSVSDGAHTLTVKATDSAGQVSSESISVTVSQPVPTGSVYIAAPKNNDTVAGQVVLSAGTENLTNVTRVEYIQDSVTNLGSAALTSYGWVLNWDTTKVSNGSHSLVARVTAGTKIYSSTPTTVNVNNVSDITAPSTPEIARVATGNYSATVYWVPSTDNIGVAGYNVYLDDRLITSTTDVSYRFENLKRGSTHVAKIVAFDAAGNQSSPGIANFKTTRWFCFKNACF